MPTLQYFDQNQVTIENRFAPWTHGHSIDGITGLRDELDSLISSGLTSTTDISFRNATVHGNIVPAVNGTQDIGSVTNRWGVAWIDELHIANNTLYLGDTPVLGTEMDTIMVQADPDQSITIKTTGTGSSKMISQNGIELSTTGMNSNVVIQSTGSNGQVSFGANASINFTAPATNVTGTLDVTGNATFSTATFGGNVIFNGDNIVLNTQNFSTQDNRIVLNAGEVGQGVTSVYAGFQIDRGTLEDWQFVFAEDTDTFQYGPISGPLSTVVSKFYVDTQLGTKLNASAYTAADVFAKVLTLDGTGSGLDADTLRGHVPADFQLSAQDIFNAVLTLDGPGSLLDADLLDGFQAAYFAPQATTYTKLEMDSSLALKLNSSAYTAADVFAKVLTLDGAGSTLDADLLDGFQAAYFSPATHNHNTAYLGITAKAADADLLDGFDSTYFAPQATTYTKLEVDAEIANLVSSAPETLDTLSELAAALGNDPNFATTVSTELGLKLYKTSYTAADVLAKMLTVDGAGSTLDADLLDGFQAAYFSPATHNHNTTYLGITATAADSALLGGFAASYFAPQTTTYTKTETNTLLNAKLNASAYTAADVFAKVLTLDGTGSGLDADLLDGFQASYFSPSTHTHASTYLGITAKAADADKLDSLDSTQFLRSDVDAALAGKLTVTKELTGTSSYTNGQLELKSNGSAVSLGFSTGGTAAQLRHVSDGLILSGASEVAAANLVVTGNITGSTITAAGFSGPLGGNATTATALQTARTINGTSFDGSANITTANWGTTRTFTIGSTGKSVNGGGNVSWNLTEIGAAATSHTHTLANITDSGNLAAISTNASTVNYLRGDGNWVTPPNTTYALITEAEITTGTDATSKTISAARLAFLRGTAAPQAPGVATVGTAVKYAREDHVHALQTTVTGNAGTATTLQTARTINGTSFNGSAAITTANWGTSRTLTIGSTGKAVSGAADVAWTLAEIGAAATSHTHTLANITDSGNLAAISTNASTVNYLRGDGTWVTPPNTTYAVITAAEITTGTATTLRTISGATAKLIADRNVGTAVPLAPGTAAVGTSLLYARQDHRHALQTTVTGNAGTATTLQTARTINGVSFNGSANITITAAATNVNTQLASLGVGTAASGVAGEVRATNNVTAYYSDERLKTFSGKIENALDKVSQLNGYYFTENETAKSLGYDNDRVQVGVSAQEVEAVLPEIVTGAPIGGDYKTVWYEKITPLLIEAIKELRAEVEVLKNK